MTDVRSLLHDLAADAPRGHGEETADRVVELHRAQDRRRLRLAGVAVAIAVVVAAVPSLVTRSPADTAAVADAVGEVGPARGLYDLPTRGSLADDDRLLQQALSVDWADGSGNPLVASLDSRRVSFLGEVPGGQVWALVLGLADDQLVYAWFVDPDGVQAPDAYGSGGAVFQLVSGPDRAFPDTPMGLLDVANPAGPLVVVSTPGDVISYAPDGSGSTDGTSALTPVPTDDGVAVGLVTVPETGSAYPGYRVDRDGGTATYDRPPQLFDSREFTLPLSVSLPLPLVYYTVPELVQCLSNQGFVVAAVGDDGYEVDAFPDSETATLDGAQAFCVAKLVSEAADAAVGDGD